MDVPAPVHQPTRTVCLWWVAGGPWCLHSNDQSADPGSRHTRTRFNLSLECKERFGSKKSGLEYFLLLSIDLWKLWIQINNVRFYNPEVNVQPHSNLKSLNLNIWEYIPRLRALPLNRDCIFIGHTKTLTPICESSTLSGASERVCSNISLFLPDKSVTM